MFLVDTHTHLYQPAFDADRRDAMARCEGAGVDLLLLPNIDVESIPRVRDMLAKWPDRCRGMMGLHPCHVDADWRDALGGIEAALDTPFPDSPWVAIGEIGLDLHWAATTLPWQIEALKVQLEWAKQRALPAVIHVRNAFPELFEVMDEVVDDRLTGVIHCFTGGVEEARQAMKYPGWMIGIGGVSTYKNGGLDKVLLEVSLDRIVLETDSPYLAPVPFRGKRNESSHVRIVAQRVAEILGLELDEVAHRTTQNAVRLFNLPTP
ncbi:MAG: TatD family hydrolase [Bacteroidetes bacterium]|nr:TatD family hydrolase [Bacteroidota bacterium]MDA0903897.1 TatD family hydrolase [Bacteroidota bacterium]MDA1242743.1 TatD family hydrolase [Bacteroidota bacterium]